MFNPRMVVVPKPVADISRADTDVVDRPDIDVVAKYRFPPAFLKAH